MAHPVLQEASNGALVQCRTRFDWLRFIASGLATSVLASWFCSDVAFQAFIASPVGNVLASTVALFVAASIRDFNGQRRQTPMRGAVAAAVIGDLLLLWLALKMHWLSGSAFGPGLPLVGLVYGPAVAWYVAVPLVIYARVVPHSRLGATLAYVAFVSAFSLASALVIKRLLLNGSFVFAQGYSAAWDCAWGVAQYALALLVYVHLSEVAIGRHRAH